MHACAQCKFACLRAQRAEKFLLIFGRILSRYDPQAACMVKKLSRRMNTIKSRFLLNTNLFVRLTQAWRSIRDGSRMYSQFAKLGRKVGKVRPKLSLGGRKLWVKN